MNRQGALRLAQLAKHLAEGKLGHAVFNFGIWNGDIDSQTLSSVVTPHVCGTQGCAVGEAPILWPFDWTFDLGGKPLLTKYLSESDSGWAGNYSVSLTSAADWFDLTVDEADQLFAPHAEEMGRYYFWGGPVLTSNASKEAVVNNLIQFIRHEGYDPDELMEAK